MKKTWKQQLGAITLAIVILMSQVAFADGDPQTEAPDSSQTAEEVVTEETAQDEEAVTESEEAEEPAKQEPAQNAPVDAEEVPAQSEPAAEDEKEAPEKDTAAAETKEETAAIESAPASGQDAEQAPVENKQQEEPKAEKDKVAQAGKADKQSSAKASQKTVARTSEAGTKKEQAASIENVRKKIQGLSADPTSYTNADKAKVENIVAAYQALSASDRAILDEECSHSGTGQSLGRVLEAAQWGVWSLKTVDNTTTLEPGTYDASTTPALSSVYSKGKSTSSRQKPWSIKSVTVDKNHKATAVLTVESDTYSGVYYQGRVYKRTNKSGNSTFTIPVDLNSTFYFSGISETMPTPIAFSVSTTIQEPGVEPSEEEEAVEKDADYSAVDAAIKKIPKDLSIYTDKSVKTLNQAVNAVVRGKKASEQAAVDAMAKAIDKAVKGLVKKDTKPVRTNLKIKNTTGMFKAVDAYLLKEGDKEYLVLVLSGDGYHYLYKGTYEQAVKNGDGTKKKGNNKWVHGHVNVDGKWEFKIPVSKDDTYVPCVAISHTYYSNYLKGKNPLKRSFYPRQFKINRRTKTIVTGDYDEKTTFTVKSKVADVKVKEKAATRVMGGPNSNNYSIATTLVMKDDTYDEVYYPTVSGEQITLKKAALKKGKFRISLLNAPLLEAFADKKPIEMTFHVAKDAPYKEAGKYVVRKVTINKSAKTIVIRGGELTAKNGKKGDQKSGKETGQKDGKEKDQESDAVVDFDPEKADEAIKKKYPDRVPSTTAAVDASTTLKDGEYTPDGFSWSGGSGRLAYIRCTKIRVSGGQAYATIEFSSPSYDSLKASGGVYSKQGGGLSTFVIPVNLNANNTIIGRTTAMSQPHWIAYTIYIVKAESAEDAKQAQEAKKETAEAKVKISEEAPEILGLDEKKQDAKEEKTYAEYFKIYNYEHGVKLLSIDISKDTALQKEYTENAEKALKVSEDEDSLEYDEEGQPVAKSQNEYAEALYKNNVINYLLVPEDYEVPAGLDKEYIIVKVPSKKSFVASAEALAMMEQLDCLDAVSLLGMDEKAVKSDVLKKAIKDKKVQLAGDTEKPDYARMVKDKTDLAVLPGDLLPEKIKKDAKDKDKLKEEAKAKKEQLEKLESRFTTLGVPVIVDRSAQEKDELAQAEWIKVYGALYGCEEEAEKLFDKQVEKAGKN